VLNGTATSVLIPAIPGAHSSLSGTLSFYRGTFATNATGYATFVDKVSETQFTVNHRQRRNHRTIELFNPGFVSERSTSM